MAGAYARAKRSADKLASNVAPVLAQMPGLEAFLPQQYYVLLRFAKWNEVLASPAPPDSLTLVTILSHYAGSVAYAAKNDLANARVEQRMFLDAAASVPPDMPVGTLNTAGQMFVARELLEGRLTTAAGDRATGIEHYQAAVDAEDAMAYDEPPTWYYPVRETLDAALLAAGRATDAERVFSEDLKYNPGNGRSLFGAWRSLDAQGNKAEAARARHEFERVWRVADVTLRIEDF